MRKDDSLTDHDRATFEQFEEDIEEGNCLRCHEPIDDDGYVNESMCADCWIDELIGMALKRDDLLWDENGDPEEIRHGEIGIQYRRAAFKARREAREVLAEQ